MAALTETAGARALTTLPGTLERGQLSNGIELVVLEVPGAPLVSSALCYRSGTRDEARGQGGIAHFLEHLMFRGGAVFGPGEIDRLTQALGGDNNAFTGHDSTVYYFRFAPEHWRVALEIEADRMAGLLLDEDVVALERQVILEEIAMYRNDPWDALDQEVQTALFDGEPYGRPILGTAEELGKTGTAELREFHACHYAPQRALLAVVGAADWASVRAACAPLESVVREAASRTVLHLGALAPAAAAATVRLERRCGEVARLLIALAAPEGGTVEHAEARLVQLLLTGGRSARLTRRLVDELRWCSWVAGDLSEHQGTSAFTVALEVVPGASARRVEREVLGQIERLAKDGPSEQELARALRIAAADWVFAHERLHHQALSLAIGEALFEREHAARQLERLLALDLEAARAACGRLLSGGRRVIGWSLP